jgi:cysteine synthase
MTFVPDPKIIDGGRRRAAVECLRRVRGRLPTWTELSDPEQIEARDMPDLTGVDPDAPDAGNLWRVHWFNDADRKSLARTPGHLVLPPELTGVKAPIVVLLGRRFR